MGSPKIYSPRGGLGGARTEEGRGVDAPVEARPALALGQLLLEAVEAPQLAAEVVDRVHQGRLAGRRDDGRAVLQLTVVGEDDVEDRLGQIRVEALDALDLPADQVIASRDLALEPARVGERDRE